VDLDEVLRTVAARAGERARAQGRSIAVSARPTIVSADPLRLEQAVGNLIDNALRYGEGAVKVWALERDGRVEGHIVDEGLGFPPEFLDRAFDRFSRADEGQARGGTGLGPRRRPRASPPRMAEAREPATARPAAPTSGSRCLATPGAYEATRWPARFRAQGAERATGPRQPGPSRG
jgi:anti-sigma regulatory factor (Ser/Thr protein kinase)